MWVASAKAHLIAKPPLPKIRIYASGWRRNHGAMELAVGDVSNAIRDDGLQGYDLDETVRATAAACALFG